MNRSSVGFREDIDRELLERSELVSLARSVKTV